MQLLTMTINALRGILDDKDWVSDIPTKEQVSTLSHWQVRTTPQIGKKGVDDIILWLAEDGLSLKDKPAPRPNVSESTIIKAKLLLEKCGYTVTK